MKYLSFIVVNINRHVQTSSGYRCRSVLVAGVAVGQIAYANDALVEQAMEPLLAVRDVSVVFGGIIALNGVSFDMQKGQILGLIGPNGAGKTTLFNCLSRLYQPSSGDILM